jgi:iron(III) transport system substrate-binding protein
MSMKTLHKQVAQFAGAALAALVLAAPTVAVAEDFDLDALIAAAKAEPPVTIYDSTGKIVEQAEAFAKKYGVQATGTKIKAPDSLEMVIREHQAHNVQADVIILSDTPAAIAQLLPEKFAESWLPPDLADKIPAMYQDPLVVSNSANVWAYNTEVFDKCPVTNIWQLTEPEWKGKVAMQDPLGKPTYDDWFNQMETHADDKVAAAYKALYGKDLATDGESATKAFVKALAQNGPLLTSSDSDASAAAGAPGQTEPFMALISTAKFRDNADKGYHLGICEGMNPWSGWLAAKVGLIAAGTDSPNASKLFIHYLMTEEGTAPQAVDGKRSTNMSLSLPADEPSGVGAIWDQLEAYDISSAESDWDAREDWQDFWRINYSK